MENLQLHTQVLMAINQVFEPLQRFLNGVWLDEVANGIDEGQEEKTKDYIWVPVGSILPGTSNLDRASSRHDNLSEIYKGVMLAHWDHGGKEERIKKLAQRSREGSEKISDQVELLLFECGEFPMAIANAILDLVALLKDSDGYGQSSRVLALAKFSEQGVSALVKFSEQGAIPDIVAFWRTLMRMFEAGEYWHWRSFQSKVQWVIIGLEYS
ncbi:hypothetical protein BU17DRAFT_64395 [Hysterangium stoloniferum]|nr:hypothetical protein BU17DRAFT_64395 [Hysterangium stoloniferum]